MTPYGVGSFVLMGHLPFSFLLVLFRSAPCARLIATNTVLARRWVAAEKRAKRLG